MIWGDRMKYLVLACLLGALTPAFAAECGALQTISSVALESSTDHLREHVPVKINGTPLKLILDTGGYTSQLTPETVSALNLPVGGALGGMKFIGSSNNKLQSVTITDFQMGSMHAANLPMLVNTMPGLGKEAAGLLAGDLFLAYDLDMDFGNDKLNFISSDHCPGKVVYWHADVVAEVPLRIVNGHYLINVTLDGKRLIALLDTGAPHSSIGMAEASRYFDLSAASPDMQPGAKVNGTVARYNHKFGTLAFEGIEVHDLTIAVLETSELDRQRPAYGARIVGGVVHNSDMILGMDVMRHFHIYIATQERKVYITPK